MNPKLCREKKSAPNLFVVNMYDTKYKEKILRAAREKR